MKTAVLAVLVCCFISLQFVISAKMVSSTDKQPIISELPEMHFKQNYQTSQTPQVPSCASVHSPSSPPA